MPVYIEPALLVIVKEAITSKYPGGSEAFRRRFSIGHPERAHQEDAELFAIAAMNMEDLFGLVHEMQSLGMMHDVAPDRDECVLIERYGGQQTTPVWLRCTRMHAWHTHCAPELQTKALGLANARMMDLEAMQLRGENVFGTLVG